MTKKLYRVRCRGMTTSVGGNLAHGIAFVVAEDAGKAYQMVRRDLDERDIGFDIERELESVMLMAEDAEYPDCGTMLYRQKGELT